jgi:hypothetical protein
LRSGFFQIDELNGGQTYLWRQFAIRPAPDAVFDLHSFNAWYIHNLGVSCSDRQSDSRLANDIHGEGDILVFNGFYGVPVCAIRYAELKEVMKFYPN